MFTILPIKGYIDQIDGFFCDGIHAGLKPNGNNDLGFIYTKEACTVAAIFTENRFQAAPLKHFLAYEEGFKTNFVLINSKNANALTGRKGIEDINTLFSKLNSFCNSSTSFNKDSAFTKSLFSPSSINLFAINVFCLKIKSSFVRS